MIITRKKFAQCGYQKTTEEVGQGETFTNSKLKTDKRAELRGQYKYGSYWRSQILMYLETISHILHIMLA